MSLAASGSRALAAPGPVSASDHSLVIAGAVNGASICNNCVGLSPAEVGALLKARERGWRYLSAGDAKLIERLQDSLEKAQEAAAGFKEKQTITDVALKGFFATLGKDNPPTEQLPQVLGQIAGGFIAARAGTASQSTDTPEIATLRLQARAALDANRDADADAIFARIAEAQRSAVSPALGQLAATIAKRGDLAISGLRYHEAADFFGQAAAIEPDARIKDGFEDREAEALATLGRDKGDNIALARAIEVDRDLLARRPRDKDPAIWAMTQNNMAVALDELGLRQTSGEMLQQSADGFNQALLVFTRDKFPLAWADAEHNLGTVLEGLSARETGTDRLRAAAAAFNAALLVRTRERTPLPWAMTKNNLGIVMVKLGEREPGVADLQAGVRAFQDALLVETKDRYPVQWAEVETNVGDALMRLGQRGSGGLDNFRAAIAAFRASLIVTTRENSPMEWAANQNNLGNALVDLDVFGGGLSNLPAAVESFQSALLENTREHDLVRWAETQADLAFAYEVLATQRHDMAVLRQAVGAYGQAMSVYSDPGFAARAAILTQAIARCNAAIAQLSGPATMAAKP